MLITANDAKVLDRRDNILIFFICKASPGVISSGRATGSTKPKGSMNLISKCNGKSYFHSSNWLSLYRSNTMLNAVDCNLELILDVLKIDLVMVIWSPNMSWNPQPEILIYGSHRNKAIYHLALSGHSIGIVLGLPDGVHDVFQCSVVLVYCES